MLVGISLWNTLHSLFVLPSLIHSSGLSSDITCSRMSFLLAFTKLLGASSVSRTPFTTFNSSPSYLPCSSVIPGTVIDLELVELVFDSQLHHLISVHNFGKVTLCLGTFISSSIGWGNIDAYFVHGCNRLINTRDGKEEMNMCWFLLAWNSQHCEGDW